MELARDAVEDQLARILTSQNFSNAGRLSSFLTFVVRKALAGESSEIKEYVVAVEVFDRPKSFDPRFDTIVRVMASKLRARLSEYYATAGANDPIIIELPRGSYIPSFRSRQTPALEAIKQAGGSTEEVPAPVRRPRHWLMAAVFAGLLLLVIAVPYALRRRETPLKAPPVRFTLLPPEDAEFQNRPAISPDGQRIISPIIRRRGRVRYGCGS
jgi:hypothetical protein